MKIWVDADACPKPIKEILCKAAERAKIETYFVANMWLRMDPSNYIKMIQVEQGSDIADDKIHELCEIGDLVITADIPLALKIVKKNVMALNPSGTLYDKNNIGQISDMRDFMDSMRGSGIETGGPKSFGNHQKQKFANELDRIITKNRP